MITQSGTIDDSILSDTINDHQDINLVKSFIPVMSQNGLNILGIF